MTNPRHLYDRNRITIGVNQRDPESHDVWIGGRDEGGAYFLLQRGVLREAATSDPNHVRQMMDAVSAGLMKYLMNERGITHEQLALACAQAYIADLEEGLRFPTKSSHTLGSDDETEKKIGLGG